MIRLSHKQCLTLQSGQNEFQFLNDPIKPQKRKREEARAAIFQFLNDPIKPDKNTKMVLGLALFQLLNDPIKSNKKRNF